MRCKRCNQPYRIQGVQICPCNGISKLLFDIESPPKVSVVPKKRTAKELKQAKLMEQFINHMYETNANGVTTKFMKLEKLWLDNWKAELLWGIPCTWDESQKQIDDIVNEEKKVQ